MTHTTVQTTVDWLEEAGLERICAMRSFIPAMLSRSLGRHRRVHGEGGREALARIAYRRTVLPPWSLAWARATTTKTSSRSTEVPSE